MAPIAKVQRRLAGRLRFRSGCVVLIAALAVPAVVEAQQRPVRPAPTSRAARPASTGLAYGEMTQVGNLNPYAAPGSRSGSTDRTLSMLYEPLFRFNFGTDEYENVLAAGVRALPRSSKSPAVYAVELKRGVTWHDGTPVTGHDVVFTYEYIRKAGANERHRKALDSLFAVPPRVDPRNEQQVIFEFRRPVEDPRYHLTDFIIPAAPFDRNTYAEVSEDRRLSERPLGTGPFRFDSWGTSYPILKPYDKYHGSRSGNLATVAGQYYSDPTTMVTSFTQGARVNLIVEVPSDLLPQVEAYAARGAATQDELESYNVYAIAIRQKPGSPLADARVRRAMTRAVDREQLLHNWWMDKGVVLASPVTPTAPFYDAKVRPLGFDPEAARRELRQAVSGVLPELKFIYPRGASGFDTRVLNAVTSIKDGLEKIGFRVRPVPLEHVAFNIALFEKHDFDLAWVRWEFNPAYDLLPLFHARETGPGGMNIMNFRDAEVSQLLEEFREASDERRRQLKMYELQAQLNNKAPAIFLLSEKQSYAYQTDYIVPSTRVDPFYFFTYVGDWCVRPCPRP